MKNLVGICTGLFVALLGLNAYAAQASAQDVRCPGNLKYNETTGICVAADSTTSVPTFYYNGEPAQLSNIKTVGESFDYGDGLGIICESTFRPGDAGFIVAQGGAACDTTCGSYACVAGLDTSGAADGADFELCSDASADSCLCMVTGLDLLSVGCGADWETPDEGVDLVTTSRGFKFMYYAGAAQAIGPDMDLAADGLDIGCDQTDGDLVEIFTGIYGASGAPMVPGVDPAFQLCVTFELSTVAGTDALWFGWRSVEIPNDDADDYNTRISLGFTAADGDWYEAIEDDAGGVDEDDLAFTALADATQVEACVRISDSRKVSYCVNGTCLDSTDADVVDTGEPLLPFFSKTEDAALTGATYIQEWEVSYYNDGD